MARHPSAPPGPGAETQKMQLWRHKRWSLGQEELHRGCWVVAPVRHVLSSGWKETSGSQTCAWLWRADTENSGTGCGRESAEVPAGLSPARGDPQECQALPFAASPGQPVSWEEGRPRGPWDSPLLVTGWPSPPVVGLEPPGSPERQRHIQAVSIHYRRCRAGKP